jgi:hypothetical protein
MLILEDLDWRALSQVSTQRIGSIYVGVKQSNGINIFCQLPVLASTLRSSWMSTKWRIPGRRHSARLRRRPRPIALSKIPSPSPPSSRRPSVDPIDTTDADDDDAHPPDNQPPNIAKALRSSISRTTRTPQLVSSESEDDVDESRELPLVHHKRRSSIDSSRSASVALDVETAAADAEVDEPPPSTGSTVGAFFEAPPLSTESVSNTVNLTTEECPPSPDHTPSLAPDTSTSNPPAKSGRLLPRTRWHPQRLLTTSSRLRSPTTALCTTTQRNRRSSYRCGTSCCGRRSSARRRRWA